MTCSRDLVYEKEFPELKATSTGGAKKGGVSEVSEWERMVRAEQKAKLEETERGRLSDLKKRVFYGKIKMLEQRKESPPEC